MITSSFGFHDMDLRSGGVQVYIWENRRVVPLSGLNPSCFVRKQASTLDAAYTCRCIVWDLILSWRNFKIEIGWVLHLWTTVCWVFASLTSVSVQQQKLFPFQKNVTEMALDMLGTALDASHFWTLHTFVTEPKRSSEIDDSVKVGFRKTSNEFIPYDSKKVLLDFHTPWWYPNKTLQSEVKQLEEHLKEVWTIVIASMQADVNEHSCIQIQGHLTVLMFPVEGTATSMSEDST